MVFASYVFYGSWDWKFVFLLAAPMLGNQAIALLIHRSRAKTSRNVWLAIGVAANLGLLAWFKYYDFFVNSTNSLAGTFGMHWNLPLLRPGAADRDLVLHLPGDELRHRHLPQGDPADRCSTPRCTCRSSPVGGRAHRAGLRVPARAQLRREPDRVERASRCAHRPGPLQEGRDFELPGLHDRRGRSSTPRANTWAFDTLLGIYGYAIQIYADFSGYTDMAIGLGTPARLPLPAELQLPVRRRVAAGLLASLAHDAVALAARLPLRAPRWKPQGQVSRGYVNLVDHHGPRRALARRGVDLRGVGLAPRSRSRLGTLARRRAQDPGGPARTRDHGRGRRRDDG